MDLFDNKGIFENNFDEPNDVPITDNLSWENMGPKILSGLEKRKKRRRIIWIWFTGIFLSLVGIGYYSIGEGSNAEIESIVNAQSKIEKVRSTNKIESSSQKSNNDIIPKSNNPKTEDADFENQLVQTHNTKELDFNTSADYQLTLSENKQGIQKTKNNLQKSNNTKSSNFKSIPNTSLQINFDSPDKLNNKYITAEDLNIVSKKQQNDYSDLDKHILIQAITTLNLTSFEYTRPYELLEMDPRPTDQSNVDITKWNLSFTIGSNVMHTKSNKSFKSTLAIEKPILGWQSNFRLRRNISKHWSIQAGLDIKQLSFKSDLQSKESVILSHPNTLDSVIVSFQTGTVRSTYRNLVPGLKLRNFQHYNKYITFKLPVLLGYNVQKRRLGVTLQTGLSLQLFRKNEGKTISTSGETLDLSSPEIYGSDVQWSVLFESQFSYRINGNTKLVALFSFDQNMRNWVLEEIDYRQKPMTLSTSLGISWSF